MTLNTDRHIALGSSMNLVVYNLSLSFSLRLVTCLTLLKHHTSLFKTTRSHLYDKNQGYFVKPDKQRTDLKSSDQELTPNLK